MTSIRSTVKRRFLAGLIILIPGIITISAIVWFFRFVDGFLGPLFDRILGYSTAGLGFLSVILLVFVVGVISTNVFGKKVIAFMEKLILRIPVFKGFYTAIKQLVDAFSPEDKSSFKEFVVVEYPRLGAYAFGFLTKECTIKSGKSGCETCLRAVYIPTNNLYLGEIVLFKEEEVFYTDIPIDEGIKIILSGGIAAPGKITETTAK
ncbi:MAG TPA: DUF502 domain-containing protein [Thermodesulfovibrionales bacterium]|nr:DUF502 domain-containing protein [Thermodesulfovibrionales bacterium]